MLQKDKQLLQNPAGALQYEWLETNGLGGWAGATITGAHTRRYHGLLVGAIEPPARRMVLVSKLDETIVLGGQRYELGTNVFQQEAVHPAGYQYMTQFTKDLFPEWQYELPGISLVKTIAMVQDENTTLVLYHVLQAAQPFILELQPFLGVRDYHALVHENNAVNKKADFAGGLFHTKMYEGTPDIYIHMPGSDFSAHPDWYRNFYYLKEKGRGLDFEEDLFSHGHFSIHLKHNDILGIIISTEDPGAKDAQQLYAAEKSRKQLLREGQPADELLQQLLLAADQFIVQRGGTLKTVIAGYHWFTDWTRDTMISLPGLCLCTGRFEDAAGILETFSQHISEGLLPNRFMDNGQAPEYNTVDGTLWYFIAIYKYWLATGDKTFILQKMLPVLKEIIAWHRRGTKYHIHEEVDGLLYAGEPGVQLTWMDAKVGDRVITPRTGKAVEIQALWYNALRIYAGFLALNEEEEEAVCK
jgi:predicted glycogen debranching enzyme